MNQMRKVTQTQPSVIHFRRWSRKRYAVFCSIGRCVSIRQVNKSVSDASLKKQKPSLTMPFLKLTGEPDSGEKEGEADESPSLLRLITILIQPQTVTETCGCSAFVLNKPDENIAGQIPYYICPAFYVQYNMISIHD
jgi:hypothetical protein